MFKLNINLDDKVERDEFLSHWGASSPRSIAHGLKLTGKGAVTLASDLKCYAWNAHTAHGLREEGNIGEALRYEKISDSIYKDISKVCECW